MKPFALAGALVLFAAGPAVATEVADYRFQSSYDSSIAAAPALIAGSGQTFQTDWVFGTPSTVLAFPGNSGLALTPASALLGSGGYSIALLARLDVVTSYRKYVDFADRTADAGLYNNGGKLELFGPTTTEFAGSPASIVAGTYHWIVFTRDAAGAVAAYVDRVPQFAGADTRNLGQIATGPGNPAGTLVFFADDTSTGGLEAAAGRVARLRLFDHVLSQAEVDLIGEKLFGNGFD